MKRVLQFIFAVVIIILGVMSVSYLQHRFDRSDVKHAVQAVQTARPLGATSPMILEEVAAYYQVAPEEVLWDAVIESKTQGVVTVKAFGPQGRNGGFVWQVDLVRFNVIPVNQAAQELGGGKP